MSFSNDIKKELCEIRVRKKEELHALLTGLTQTCSSLRIGRNVSVLFQSESEPVVALASSAVAELWSLDAVIGTASQEHRKNPLYIATVSGEKCRSFLLNSGVMTETPDGISFEKHIPETVLNDENLRRCFLRGTFLGAGSASDPKSGYHLEIVASDDELANVIGNCIDSFALNARDTVRRGQRLIYLKGEDVSGFLALIGASSAALRFEDARTTKEFRNYINRKNNCETSNIDKTVRAGLKHLRAIEILEKHMDLSELPAPLYEAAALRLRYPDMTLQQLAEEAEIGKSGMNHRFQHLIDMAEELEGNPL